MRLSLTRISALMEKLNFSFRDLPPVVHVAGTNGKGSTIQSMEGVLQGSSYKVHKYTSPHLVSPCERIVLAGTPVEPGVLRSRYKDIEKLCDPEVSYFEKLTATAFTLFREFDADIILLEVGLGGRLDATNLIHPILSVITPISLDHVEELGYSIESIAKEKAGIIKSNSLCLSAHQPDSVIKVLKEACYQLNTKFYLHKKICGDYREQNASLGLRAIEILSDLGFKKIDNTLNHVVKFPQARLQKLSIPLPRSKNLKEVILDGAHNVGGAIALKSFLEDNPLPTYAIACIHKRKDINGFKKVLESCCEELILMPMEERKKPWMQVLRNMLQLKIQSRYRILLTGSLYFGGEILRTYIQK